METNKDMAKRKWKPKQINSSWKMIRDEGHVPNSKPIVREMVWYERIYYWKGLPLEMEAWNINTWAFSTFCVCLLFGLVFQGRLPADLDGMFMQVARFIVFVIIIRVIFGLIIEFVLGYFVERKDRRNGHGTEGSKS